MQIRGAGKIACAGASALCDFSDRYEGGSIEGFKEDLDNAVREILGSRPTAVSLWNGVHACIRDVDSACDLDAARATVSENARRFVELSARAVEAIGRIGSKRIADGDTVLTHCNSSAALEPIKRAHAEGKELRVYATESRPWRQGVLTVNELADAGIDVTLIVDSSVRTVMKRVDKVFVGADTITSNGTLINKIGTSQLALCADEARVPFHVCSETYKFSPMTMFGDMVTIEERDCDEVAGRGEIRDGVRIFNPVFDSTPGKYIDAIITEVGVISPGSVYDIMVRQLGDGIFEERG